MIDALTGFTAAAMASQMAGNIYGMFSGGSEGLSRADLRFLADKQWNRDDRNEQFQHDLAEHGIAMRVADAEAAGIHPLAALGAIGPSGGFSNSVSIGGGSYGPGKGARIAEGLHSMGQDLSRAANNFRTKEERAQMAAELDRVKAETRFTDQQRLESFKRMLLMGQPQVQPLAVEPSHTMEKVEGFQTPWGRTPDGWKYVHTAEHEARMMASPISGFFDDAVDFVAGPNANRAVDALGWMLNTGIPGQVSNSSGWRGGEVKREAISGQASGPSRAATGRTPRFEKR